MVPLPTAADLLSDLSRRGFTLRVTSGALAVSPASALGAADRGALRARRDELVALLSATEPWDAEVAHRLMFDADELVGALGVSGLHPAVVTAAEAVGIAHVACDLPGLRRAVLAFEVVVRGLAAPGTRARPERAPPTDTNA